ncbi:hypothetical protein J4457_05105 [Candidatus Woesearchaeota archaeon]|nr:hypothetical protein [Candidatus Woesearchaeota archaeon]
MSEDTKSFYDLVKGAARRLGDTHCRTDSDDMPKISVSTEPLLEIRVGARLLIYSPDINREIGPHRLGLGTRELTLVEFLTQRGLVELLLGGKVEYLEVLSSARDISLGSKEIPGLERTLRTLTIPYSLLERASSPDGYSVLMNKIIAALGVTSEG